jgi:hypothetical protein
MSHEDLLREDTPQPPPKVEVLYPPAPPMPLTDEEKQKYDKLLD